MVQLIKVKVSVDSICKTFGELLSNPAYPHPNQTLMISGASHNLLLQSHTNISEKNSGLSINATNRVASCCSICSYGFVILATNCYTPFIAHPFIPCYSYWTELLDLSRLPYDAPYREAKYKLLPEASSPNFLGGKMSS